MPQDILNQVGDAIGGFFANPIVEFAIQAIGLYIVILWLAAAYWAFRDMQQRTDNPVLPYLAAALVVLFTPVLFVFGIIVYRIVRPHEKIGEIYDPNVPDVCQARGRGVDHLSDLPYPAQQGVRSLRAPGGS
jgi:hypothetical protein